MSRPMQFPKCFPWLIVAIVMLTGLPVLPMAASLWLMTPPLQKHYLITYLDSTECGNQPDATTKVEWLLKTAPGRKPGVALNADVVSATIGNGNLLPVKLSAHAVTDGWREGVKREPQQVESARLERYLETAIYDGNDIWRMVLHPLLACAAAVIFCLECGRGGRPDRNTKNGTGGARRDRNWHCALAVSERGRKMESAFSCSGEHHLPVERFDFGSVRALAFRVGRSPAPSCSWATLAAPSPQPSGRFSGKSRSAARQPSSMIRRWTLWASPAIQSAAT
jgi:hypothetical protein